MIAKCRMIIKFVEIVKEIVSRAYQTLIKAAQTLSQLLPNMEQIYLPRQMCRFRKLPRSRIWQPWLPHIELTKKTSNFLVFHSINYKKPFVSVLRLNIWSSWLVFVTNKLICNILKSNNYIFTIFFPCLLPLPHFSASLPRSIATLLHGICTSVPRHETFRFLRMQWLLKLLSLWK